MPGNIDSAAQCAAIRRALRRFFVGLLIGAGTAGALGQPKPEFFVPPSGKGPVVVVASGADGVANYREFSARLAERGYFTALVDGKSILGLPWEQAVDGVANLNAVVGIALSAPQSTSDKVVLIGLSRGGGGVLVHGRALGTRLSAVIAYYPATAIMGADLPAVAAKFNVPTLVLAGEQDRYNNCCLIESMRILESAPKPAPFELVVYPEAGHAFTLKAFPTAYRSEDAEDAWMRTLAFLAKHHPVAGR